MHRLVRIGLVSLMALAAASVPNSAGGVAGFGDVPRAAFYTEAVQWMVDNEITTGTSPTCFSPNSPVTRGQAAAFMWRMEGEPDAEPHQFEDVAAPWQQGPVSWMFERGITTGTSPSKFSPDGVLTRGQLAALLWRLAGEPSASPHSFIDVISPWQQGPVSWMATADPVITTGTSAVTFSPNAPVTRGQLATFFHRYKGEPSVSVEETHPTYPACVQQVPGPTTTTTTTEPPTTTTTAPISVTPPSTSECFWDGVPLQGSVYFTDYSWAADLSVYFTSYSWAADLNVYFTDYSWAATSCGLWYEAPYSWTADFVVYATPYSWAADLSAYVTTNSWAAG